MAAKSPPPATYYFVDVHLGTQQLVGWGTEQKERVEVQLTEGYHRVFLSKGQYNKLVEKLRSVTG